jgi:PAS domain S-box-containing protein
MGIGERKKLLLVEDEALIAISEKNALEDYGYSVITATTGEKAIEIVKANEIDLILMDINLGKGIDGTQAAELILEDHDIPIVFLSSHSEREVVEKTEKITSYGYVVKDSSITVLDASIKMAFKLFFAKIEEQKKEARLHENEEQYRLLHENAGLGIGYYSVDGVVLSYNNLAARHMNGIPEDFIGKSICEIFPRSDAESYHDRIKKSALSEKPEIYEDFVKLPTSDMFFLSTFTRITDLSGNILGIQIISQDITQRKKAELALTESIKVFTTLAELAPVGIYLTNPNGDCTYANPAWCKMAGLSLEEAKGQGWIKGLHPDDAHMVFSQWKQMVASKGKWGLEYRFQDKHGVVTDVFGLASAQYNNDGDVDHYVGVNIDITESKKAQKAFRENEAKLQSIYDGIPDVIFLVDVEKNDEFRFNDINHVFLSTTGLPAESIIGRRVDDVIPEPSLSLALGKYRQAITEKTLVSWEETTVYPTGKHTSLVSIMPILGIDGTCKRLVGTAHDITERKQTEEALREEHNSLLRSQRMSKVGSWTFDPDSLHIEWSEEMYVMYGLDSATHPISISKSRELVHPDDRERYDDLVQLSLAASSPFKIDLRGMRPDGTSFYQTTWGEIEVKEDGSRRIVGTTQDISEHQRVEEALLESERKYRSLIENSSDAIFCVDEQGQYQFTNQLFASTFGKTPDYFIGKTFWDIYPKDHADFRQAVSKKVFETGESQSAEVVVPLEDRTLYFLAKANPIKDETGKVVMNLTHATDITDRKQAEEKVKSLLAEKELLLKEVHHRIKNNMNTVSSLLSLQAATLKEFSAISALEDAIARVRSMGLLYDKLYRSENFIELSIKDYLPSLIDEIISNFPNSKIVKVEKSIQDFVLDAKSIQTLGIIINELLTNIMKYAFKGREAGLITLIATNLQDHVSIVVQDNGNGIPESITFENTIGFGLLLISALTKQLKGTIRMERGNGTRFILEFEI